MTGVQIFTDPTHALFSQEVFPALRMPGAQTLEIGESTPQDFLGFGVAITGSSCYELNRMAPDRRRELLRAIYSPEGAGLSIGRLSIGASDYSAELYSYDDVPFDTELKHFSVERDEAYIIPMIQEILAVRPDLYLFASPWSPPGWMKTGGHMCGGYMREEFLDCYADYIIKYLEAYAAHGIKISALTPQNEPNTQQKGLMPACVWHPETEAAFIKILRKKLTEHGLDVEIWMLDHSFYDVERVIWSLDNCEGLAESCDGVGFHYYGGVIEQTDALRRAYPRLALHFTEGGPRLTDHYDTDWCKWSIMMAKALMHGYRSFTGWNLMLNEMGGPNIGPYTCGGLLTQHSVTGELSESGQLKAFRHIAPYMTPDSKIAPLTVDGSFGQPMFGYPKVEREITGVCVDNGDGKTVLVLVNPNESKRQTQVSVGGTWWYLELPGDSVSTVIFE